MIVPTRIAARLRELGLNERHLVAMTGLKQSHLNRIKNGRIQPQVSTALVIATALDARVEDLWPHQRDRARLVTLPGRQAVSRPTAQQWPRG